MGINDRDYIRSQPTGGPGAMRRMRQGGLLSLSITNWIIIINCLIFAFDAIASSKWTVKVDMREVYINGLPTAEEQRTYRVDTTATVAPGQAPGLLNMFYGHPIYAPSGEVVGFKRFMPMPPLQAIGHFSTGKGFRDLEVWRMVFFQFLHANINHLVMNMMGLFFFGPVVERFLGGGRRYLAFYLICGIAGAIMYLILNLLGGTFGLKLPGLLVEDMYTPLIGASAGVFGVLIACAYVAGDAEMLIFMILPMKIRTGAYLMAAIAMFNLVRGSANAGGEAAHVGGIIAGYYFIRHPYLLRDFFDFFGTRTRIKRPTPSRPGGSPGPDRQKIDAILDKIQDRGMQSLTEAEKRLLEQASKH